MNIDYTNTMASNPVATPLKLIFFSLIALNIYFYKKYKIADKLEERLPMYIMSFASLSFLLASVFIFATYGKDIYLEIVSIVLGIGISLSYINNIYEDAEDKKIGKKWFIFITILFIDLIVFCLIPDKIIAFALALTQNLIFMIYETKKEPAIS